ncbi:BTB/POZ domain-containing protein [Ditylenchus destructor]|uniref:BTB/POZ domain-containing protein n=1 Tax=Ditylenchus destructor TaxID=166010 RepID=A0AAD4QXT2_9BILA|nr:BTB/POZ domain-containing protein [Ditylenchus destructor]
MSQSSFAFDFKMDDFTNVPRGFQKSNVVQLQGSKWYLGVEKTQSMKLDYRKVLDVFLTCYRGVFNGIYKVNLALMLRGSLIDLLFTRAYYFEPMDLEMSCFMIDFNCISDKHNGFINEVGECQIMAEISVSRINSQQMEQVCKGFSGSDSPSKELNGIINLRGGYRVRVNKELLSSHSEYFNNIFNNENFEECSQEAIDLTYFTYKQFRLLYNRIYQSRNFFTAGTVEFRLKSEAGVRQFQKLTTTIQDYFYALLRKIDDCYIKQTLELTLSMHQQMRVLLELICCVSTERLRMDDQMVSAENVEDLLSVGSYFQVPKILGSCKAYLLPESPLFCYYKDPDFNVRHQNKLVEKYNLTSAAITPPGCFITNGMIEALLVGEAIREQKINNESKAANSGLILSAEQKFELCHQLDEIRLTMAPIPNIIRILVTFSYSEREEICHVVYTYKMRIYDLTQDMFSQLDVCRDYEMDQVRMYDPMCFIGPINMIMQDLVRLTSSTIYSIQLKRRAT